MLVTNLINKIERWETENKFKRLKFRNLSLDPYGLALTSRMKQVVSRDEVGTISVLNKNIELTLSNIFHPLFPNLQLVGARNAIRPL